MRSLLSSATRSQQLGCPLCRRLPQLGRKRSELGDLDVVPCGSSPSPPRCHHPPVVHDGVVADPVGGEDGIGVLGRQGGAPVLVAENELVEAREHKEPPGLAPTRGELVLSRSANQELRPVEIEDGQVMSRIPTATLASDAESLAHRRRSRTVAGPCPSKYRRASSPSISSVSRGGAGATQASSPTTSCSPSHVGPRTTAPVWPRCQNRW